MPRRSSNRLGRRAAILGRRAAILGRRAAILGFCPGIAVAFCLSLAGQLAACPFCTVVQPSLAELREQSPLVLLAEWETATAAEAAAPGQTAATNHAENAPAGQLRVRHRFKPVADEAQAAPFAIESRLPLERPMRLPSGSLVLLFGTAETLTAGTAEAIAADETLLGYFAASPTLRTPAHERLVYFAPYLEHANREIAADAYAEFGRAPLDAVASVASHVAPKQLAEWLESTEVPPERKGLYGLMLGLERDPTKRQANLAVLRRYIERPESDFRGGFDGVLGGYLLLGGTTALQEIETRLLTNPEAPRGDLLHALTALRFYQEFGRDIPRPRLAEALAHLLERPEYASVVIVDLARWQSWQHLPRVVALWESKATADRARDRAIVGYLTSCPLPAAAEQLARLRAQWPERVEAAERSELLPATPK